MAAAWVATMVLGACGGGGGGGGSTSTTVSSGGAGGVSPAPAPPPAPAPGPAPAPQPVNLSQNIAAWGDSLTPGMAANLETLYPARQIYDGGVLGETSTDIARRATADTTHRDWISIFWYGQNNVDEPNQIKADIAASIASLAPGNNHFIVMAVVNEATPAGERGGSEYATIIQLNNELAAAYPDNYIDIRTYMVSQYDPNSAQDRQDYANDVVPSSLRADIIHMTYEGGGVVAAKVREFIDAKGW
jgi:hypothetical protein